MAENLAYDLHDEVSIHAERLALRYGTSPAAQNTQGHNVRVRKHFHEPFPALHDTDSPLL
jgi:hypothetical protein